MPPFIAIECPAVRVVRFRTSVFLAMLINRALLNMNRERPINPAKHLSECDLYERIHRWAMGRTGTAVHPAFGPTGPTGSPLGRHTSGVEWGAFHLTHRLSL